ncbi:MAG: helix-turn-helix transcriptional regulator [Limisphaerales bacterium]
MKRPKTLQEAVEMLMWLKDQLLGVRLDRKQLQQRYGWSESTVDRRIADGTIPKPLRFGGRPMWRLGDLADAELTGQLPCPVSSEPAPVLSTNLPRSGRTSA